MGILSAMRSGVSGLYAQSQKLAVISDNISNSGTVGYKRNEAQFSTLVTEQIGSDNYSAGGVRAPIRRMVSKQGALMSTASSTDLAVNGRGFFVVADKFNPDAATDQFTFTRAGSFFPDADGNLRNTAGNYLQGWKVDSDGKTVVQFPSRDSFADLETVNVTGLNFSGEPTTEVEFAGNLPAQTADGTNSGEQLQTTIEYFDDLGKSRQLTLQWTATAVPNQWNLNILDGIPLDTAPVSVYSGTVNFNALAPSAGSPASITGYSADNKLPLTVNGGVQNLEVSLGELNGFDGVTQFAGSYVPTKIYKNGAKFGTLTRVEVDSTGLMSAIFDNGVRRSIYQIPVADVTNPDGLTGLDGNLYQMSKESGGMYLWEGDAGPSGSIAGYSLEQSNVDIAEELTNLIETQRVYSSNANIIRTADEMLQETTSLKR